MSDARDRSTACGARRATLRSSAPDPKRGRSTRRRTHAHPLARARATFARERSPGLRQAPEGVAVIPGVEVALVIGVDAGLDDVVIARRFARRRALEIHQQLE